MKSFFFSTPVQQQMRQMYKNKTKADYKDMKKFHSNWCTNDVNTNGLNEGEAHNDNQRLNNSASKNDVDRVIFLVPRKLRFAKITEESVSLKTWTPRAGAVSNGIMKFFTMVVGWDGRIDVRVRIELWN